MRYTVPKFVCLSYPPGTTSFDVTWAVGPNNAETHKPTFAKCDASEQ